MDIEPRSSRRLTGPNTFLPGFGAVLEAPVEEACAAAFVSAWQDAVRQIWDELAWPAPVTEVHRYTGFAALAASAPEDALYTACEANETAWAMAVRLEGFAPAEYRSIQDLRQLSEAERSPRRLEIAAAAAHHGLRFFADDELVSVGSGRGCKVWAVHSLPDPSTIDWEHVHDIPVALITGTNGKTTTVRMLSAIAAAAGLMAGNTSTDGVQLGGDMILEGDYTGGEGARILLRDARVDIAFLEVARGGMLRRGLPVETADAAYVTNIGTDHLGEYGIDTLDRLAEVKLLVAKATAAAGTLVLNGDDARLAPALSAKRSVAVLVDPQELPAHGFVRHRGRLGPVNDSRFVAWLEQADIPATLGGAAVHNIYNALGAMAVAVQLGIERGAVVEGLSTFASDSHTNPGRCNLFDLCGLRVIVDYAHNPEGLEVILQTVAALRPQRTLVVIGQAGDRDDASIDALADTCVAHAPDYVIVKTMEKYSRGRDATEVSQRILQRLRDGGLPDEHLASAPDEIAAVHDALEWGREGDLLLLLSQADRNAVLQLLESLRATAWQPGSALPCERTEGLK